MALAPLPSWLDISPAQFLQARKAGADVGLNMAQNKLRSTQMALEAGRAIAEMSARSQEAAARRAQEDQQLALRQWELEQNLAAKAAAQQAEGAQAASALEETARWHNLQNAADTAKLEAQQQHWTSLETAKDAGEIRTLPNGELVQVFPDGSWKQIKGANPAGGTVTPTAVFSALGSEMGMAGMLDRQYWPGATEQFRSYVRPTFGAPSATNTVAAPVANEVERKTSDGRTAIFDATTKKFLRYKE